MNFSDFFPIWSKLTSAQQQLLEHSAVFRKAEKGDVVHNGSIQCTGLLLVGRGQFRAYFLSEDGREITLYRLFERDICLFSAACMISSIQFDIIVEAEKEAEYWVIPPEVYKDLMAESAPISNYTNELMASRFSDVMWLMEQVLWKSFDKRLARFLLDEAVLEASLTLKITHEDIGNHLGNPREVVTRMLRYFQTEEMVKLNRGTIEITNPEKLEAILD